MRYKAPLFFKLYFYLPNDPNNRMKNVAHIRYIGCRPGVDLSKERELIPEELQPGTAAHHVKYAHERPRSNGLFSSGDDDVDIKEIQDELLHHKGIVWRLILSLHEEDAQRLDMINRTAWEETVKQNIPQMAELMGIQPSNLRWVAAYHPEKGHPHTHIVFWEKNPKRRKGFVPKDIQKNMRRVYVQKIYAADRDRLAKIKTEKREQMRALGISKLREAVEFSRMWNIRMREAERLHNLAGTETPDVLPPTIDKTQNTYLINRLRSISEKLPGRGRLMLKFMPEEVKREVKEVAKWLYQQSQFNPLRIQYEQAAEALAQPYTSQERQLAQTVEKAREDIIERLSQVVLRAANEIGKENLFEIHPEKMQIVIDRICEASGRVIDHTPVRLAHKILHACHQSGLSKEDYANVISKLHLPEIQKDVVEHVFQTPPIEKRLTKMSAYLLKATLGEEDAAKILSRLGYTDDQQKLISSYSRTSTDHETLAKVFRIPDEQFEVVSKMAKVLLAAGISKETTRMMIENWNNRSGSNVSKEKIDKAMKQSDREISKLKEWGRNFQINKKDFTSLCNSLHIDAPYPWRSLREKTSVERIHQSSVVQGLFKSVLKQITVALKRTEAQKEIEQQKLLNLIARNIEREEQERDRKEKERRSR